MDLKPYSAGTPNAWGMTIIDGPSVETYKHNHGSCCNGISTNFECPRIFTIAIAHTFEGTNVDVCCDMLYFYKMKSITY